MALLLILVNGLVPALGEGVEMIVHLAVSGHLAHSESDQGDLGDLGDEHGCGPIAHHCGCCLSQQVLVSALLGFQGGRAAADRLRDEPAQRASAGFRGAVFRPPIATAI